MRATIALHGTSGPGYFTPSHSEQNDLLVKFDGKFFLRFNQPTNSHLCMHWHTNSHFQVDCLLFKKSILEQEYSYFGNYGKRYSCMSKSIFYSSIPLLYRFLTGVRGEGLGQGWAIIFVREPQCAFICVSRSTFRSKLLNQS